MHGKLLSASRDVCAMESNELIRLVQVPVIEESLQTLRDHWEQMAADADAMVCTEDTIQSVKASRAETTKEFKAVEAQRLQVKRAYEEPLKRFEALYKECVTDAYKRADGVYGAKISAVESEIKRRCEDGLRDYFTELCAAYHVEWLRFEQSGIKVDLTSAKQKTPKKLRWQLEAFVVKAASDVEAISHMEGAKEVLAEYKLTLDLSKAIAAATDCRRRIEEAQEELSAGAAIRSIEAEAFRRVEALPPPTIVKQEKDPNEILHGVAFALINPTRGQVHALGRFMDENGIAYDVITADKL